jgi:hypothetical protein
VELAAFRWPIGREQRLDARKGVGVDYGGIKVRDRRAFWCANRFGGRSVECMRLVLTQHSAILQELGDEAVPPPAGLALSNTPCVNFVRVQALRDQLFAPAREVFPEDAADDLGTVGDEFGPGIRDSRARSLTRFQAPRRYRCRSALNL